jgi:hypothetical protein
MQVVRTTKMCTFDRGAYVEEGFCGSTDDMKFNPEGHSSLKL